jgi:taurine--2-oxoglutarate transaminase
MIDLDDQDILPLSLEHGFWSWSAQGRVNPIPVTKAQGVYFWDADGKRYLDFNSMLMCVNIGHGDRRVIQAIIDQANELPFIAPSMAGRARADLGRLLAQVTPGDLNRFFFTLGGADANENAVKLARAYTGRTKILTYYRSFHGATMGAMALTGDPRRWTWEPALMPGVVHFTGPYRYRSPFHPAAAAVSEGQFSRDYLSHLEEIITFEGPETIAAILVESVVGTNGILIPPEGYLEGMRRLCDRYGILLIADEVMSGFGRTGQWFAVDNWGVVPDMITMAKGITSAYAPLGAVAMRPQIAEFFDDRVYQGGLTYSSHPISLAAAAANIRVIHEDGLVERSRRMGAVLARHLADMGEAHPSVGEVRSIGLFGALELVRDRATRQPMADFNSSSPEMTALRNKLLELGVYVFVHWNVVLVVPPLIITEEELAEGFSALDKALEITDQAARF